MGLVWLGEGEADAHIGGTSSATFHLLFFSRRGSSQEEGERDGKELYLCEARGYSSS